MDRHVSVGNILERLCGRTGSGPGLRGRAGLAGSRGVEGSVAGSLADGMSHAGRRYGLCGGGKASQGWWGPESEGGEENIEDEEREREEKVAWSKLRNHFWMHPVPEAELCLVHDEELSMA